jgi:hypothetical protein
MPGSPGVGMGGGEADIARVRQALGSLIDRFGLRRREIDRRLGRQGCSLDVSRLLGGNCTTCSTSSASFDVHPVEFFRLVFKDPESTSWRAALWPSGPQASSRSVAPRFCNQHRPS